jgi:hypothetical protein
MGVRAKMFVQEISRTTYGGVVKLGVVCRGEDNKQWASATPSGSLSLTIRNELALEVFTDPGKEFYVDFTPVPDAKVGSEGMDHA